MQIRGWLVATCQKCGRRFSTGIRMEAAERYGMKGWNVRCPHCGAVRDHENELRVPAPVTSAAPLTV